MEGITILEFYTNSHHHHSTFVHLYTCLCSNRYMRSLIVSLALSLGAFAEAVSVPSVHDGNSSESTQSAWSRQDVFTFVSVCVAVAGIATAILVAAPRFREWCCKPFACKLNSTNNMGRGAYDTTGTPKPHHAPPSSPPPSILNCIMAG